MKIFFEPITKHLIIAPNRNGSSHLTKNMHEYQLLDVSYQALFNSIIDIVEKKTFLYRDPCIRLMSFYSLFVHQPYLEKINKVSTDSTKVKKNKTYFTEQFGATARHTDLLHDMVLAKSKIEQNYMKDTHTMSQYEFFNTYPNERVQDYEIISVSQYIKWLKLTFADTTTEVKTSSVDKISLTPSTLISMQVIQEMCHKLYEYDYTFLEPRITYI